MALKAAACKVHSTADSKISLPKVSKRKNEIKIAEGLGFRDTVCECEDVSGCAETISVYEQACKKYSN